MITREVLNQMNWVIGAPRLDGHDGSVQFGFNGVDDEPPQTHYVQQVHGTRVLQADHSCSFKSKDRHQADGIYTTEQDQMVAIQTADCLPVLLYEPHGKLVMAVHAGWKGLTSGILKSAAVACRNYVDLDDIRVVIGPAISQAAFEVGPEVVEALHTSELALGEGVAWCLQKGRDDRWHADLGMAAALTLFIHGLKAESITVSRSCTFGNSRKWHSFRRDGVDAGRNWSWIAIKKERTT